MCDSATIREIYREGSAAAIRISIPKDSDDISLLINKQGSGEPSCNHGLVTNVPNEWKGKDIVLTHDPEQYLKIVQFNEDSDTYVIPLPTVEKVNPYCNPASVSHLLDKELDVHIVKTKTLNGNEIEVVDQNPKIALTMSQKFIPNTTIKK